MTPRQPLCISTATKGSSAESAEFSIRMAQAGAPGSSHGSHGRGGLLASPGNIHARVEEFDERAKKAAFTCTACRYVGYRPPTRQSRFRL